MRIAWLPCSFHITGVVGCWIWLTAEIAVFVTDITVAAAIVFIVVVLVCEIAEKLMLPLLLLVRNQSAL